MKEALSFLKRGIISNNSVFVLLLGFCPLLGASGNLRTGTAMGIITLFTLVASGVVISLVRKLIPERIKPLAYIIIVTCFVSVAGQVLRIISPSIFEALGIYLPVLSVSGILFAGADGFADKNNVKDSALNALSMGLGFLLAIILLSAVREILGSGTVFGKRIFSVEYASVIVGMPAGGFILLGVLMAFFRKMTSHFGRKEGKR